ncbi:MAG: hypothetical protein LBM09_00335 [Candidatus Nomurabacteria bacterium]|jgi:hypothetical protein|nr:hypothetical protein [Candidatus Nomurabacteria bacterium]
MEHGENNLEKYIEAAFNIQVNVKTVVADKIPVGVSSAATVFLSDRGTLYAFIATHGGQTLGDVKKIVARMNMKADQFLPPHDDKDYFDRIAKQKFTEVFPGRKYTHDSDLIFYRTLVPYNPALVQIMEVENGIIKQYDSDAVDNWRVGVKFGYRRIATI